MLLKSEDPQQGSGEGLPGDLNRTLEIYSSRSQEHVHGMQRGYMQVRSTSDQVPIHALNIEDDFQERSILPHHDLYVASLTQGMYWFATILVLFGNKAI